MFGLVLLLISVYIGISIYTKGAEQTLDARHIPGLADAPSGGESRPVKVTDRVRDRVSSDLAAGASRLEQNSANDSD
jgi:hypothetical protein